MWAMPQEPTDHHAGDSGGDENDPHRGLGVSEHISKSDVVPVVERHYDDRRDEDGHDQEPQAS